MIQTCEPEPTAVLATEYPETKHHRGIRRLAYFLGMLGAGTLYELCHTLTGSQLGVASVGSLTAVIISLVLAVNRLRNIGMDGWAVILIFVPLANIYIGVKCLICQEGYEHTKKLDTPGRVIVGLCVTLGLLTGGGLLFEVLMRVATLPT